MRNPKRTPPFIKLPYWVHDSTTLRPIHVALLLALIRKHNGHNNGSIALSVPHASNAPRFGT